MPEVVARRPVPHTAPLKDEPYTITVERNGIVIDRVRLGTDTLPEAARQYADLFNVRTNGQPETPHVDANPPLGQLGPLQPEAQHANGSNGSVPHVAGHEA